MNNEDIEVILIPQETTVNINTEDVDVNIISDNNIQVDTIPGYNISGLVERDVNFYDYDGTLMYSFYASDFLVYNKLPAPLQRTGLIFKGWNWSLENIRTQILKVNKVNVSAIYSTLDGATKIYVDLTDERELKPYIHFAIQGTAVIDWGDGNSEEVTGSITGDFYPHISDLVFVQHEYALPGKYVISIQNEDELLYFMEGDFSDPILTENDGGSYLRSYAYKVTQINIGSNVCLLKGAFRECANLEKISLSDTCETHIIDENENSIFAYCNNLPFIGFPQSFTEMGHGSCENCFNLSNVSFPDTLIDAGTATFLGCASLKTLIIPSINETAIPILESIIQDTYNIKTIIYDYNNSTYHEIPLYTFVDAKGLQSFIIGENVETIGEYAFAGCKSLIDLEIKGSMKNIGERAFADCDKLYSLKFKNTNELNIGDYVLENNYTMKYLDFSEVQCVPQITENTFENVSFDDNTDIIVPDDYYNAYLADTNWSNYSYLIIKKSDFDNR